MYSIIKNTKLISLDNIENQMDHQIFGCETEKKWQ